MIKILPLWALCWQEYFIHDAHRREMHCVKVANLGPQLRRARNPDLRYISRTNLCHRVSMLSGGQNQTLSPPAVSLHLPGILSESGVWHTASFHGGGSSLSWVQTSCQEISPTHLHCFSASLGLGALCCFCATLEAWASIWASLWPRLPGVLQTQSHSPLEESCHLTEMLWASGVQALFIPRTPPSLLVSSPLISAILYDHQETPMLPSPRASMSFEHRRHCRIKTEKWCSSCKYTFSRGILTLVEYFITTHVFM